MFQKSNFELISSLQKYDQCLSMKNMFRKRFNKSNSVIKRFEVFVKGFMLSFFNVAARLHRPVLPCQQISLGIITSLSLTGNFTVSSDVLLRNSIHFTAFFLSRSYSRLDRYKNSNFASKDFKKFFGATS